MKEFLQKCHTVLYGTMRILVFLQIGFGVIWVLLNFGNVPAFHETSELVEISKDLITDEYIGILYPLLIRIFSIPAQVIPIPYYIYLYVLQLGVGFFAIYKVLEDIRLPNKIWPTLGIMTFPTVLPFFLAVLPQALAVSMLLLCFCSCRKNKWIQGGLFWLAASLLIWEYSWFGGMLYLFFWISNFIRKNENRKSLLLKGLGCLLIISLTIGAVKELTVVEYSRGRMKKTVVSAMMHRMVWPNFETSSYFWNAEVKELFSTDDLKHFSQNPENIFYEFGPAMEKQYGLDTAHRIYKDMASAAFRTRTKETLSSITADFMAYSIPLLFVSRNLTGHGVTYSGWNYGRMAEHAPVWTKYYMAYSSHVFGILLLLSLLTYLLRLPARKNPEKKDLAPAVCYLMIAVFQILWYTMSAAGMQDYRNVIWVSIGWGILLVCNRKEYPKV